jgi:hypothetical protein
MPGLLAGEASAETRPRGPVCCTGCVRVAWWEKNRALLDQYPNNDACAPCQRSRQESKVMRLLVLLVPPDASKTTLVEDLPLSSLISLITLIDAFYSRYSSNFVSRIFEFFT